MKKVLIIILMALGLTILGSLIGICQQADLTPTKNKSKFNYDIAGPFKHKNLTVFLIQGNDELDQKNYLTLQEAMDKKLVTVFETEEVNNLKVSNKSKKYTIFIMSGDIVKGGKQDRVIQNNYIIPPKTKKMNIVSFCVESNRWEKRDNEDVKKFSSSKKRISTKEIKLSIRKEKSQDNVWSNVEKTQNKLSDKVGNVKDNKSKSSMQLTLENENLKKAQKEYYKKLSKINQQQKNVIGYIYAINGKIYAGEIFASKFLFSKLWKKLLDSAIVEAISEYDETKKSLAISKNDIMEFITASESLKENKSVELKNTNVYEKENDENIIFETRDKKSGKWINKSFLKK